MNRTVSYLLGPELAWILMLVITGFLVSRSEPISDAEKEQILNLGWFLPIIAVLISFVPLFWAPGSQWWWLVRIGFFGLAGVLILSGQICGAVDFHDSRNSGVGTAYMLFVGLGYLFLFGGAIVAAFFFLTKWDFIPVLKWSLIIIGGFSSFLGLIFWIASFGKSAAS